MIKTKRYKSLDFMNDYFLNKTNIMKIEKSICFISDNIKKEVHKTPKNNNKDIQVKEKDVLFWYWYIQEYGFQNYEFLGKHVYKKEMEIKTKLAEKIHKEKKSFKLFKFKIPEIEQDLIYSKEISVKTFLILLFMSKIKLLYYTDVIFYETDYNATKTIIIYHDTENNIFTLKESIDDNIKNNRFLVYSLDKKIKAISNYKVSEIKEICNLINIDTKKSETKSFTKKELYEKILQKIS